MYLLTTNALFAFSIFLLTVFTGFIPLKIAMHNIKLLTLCDAFASGVFLSAALLHLLPEATHVTHSNYPIAYLICIIIFVLLLTVEKGMTVYSNKHPTNNKLIIPIFLVTLLSIHSIIEGAAIGANTNFLEATAIFFAVFSHKSSESFAMTVNLNHFGVSFKNIKRVIIWFALMTPVGIFIAAYLTSETTHYHNSITMILNAITAGTFLYLGIGHLASNKKAFESFGEISALIIGITLMAIMAKCY